MDIQMDIQMEMNTLNTKRCGDVVQAQNIQVMCANMCLTIEVNKIAEMTARSGAS